MTKCLTAVMCLVATTAYAQADGRDRVYAGGFVLASIQPEGSDDNRYVSGPLGGTAAGVSGFGGVRFGKWLSAEVEVSAGQTIAGPQGQRYNFPSPGATFTTSHRDLITTLQFRYHPADRAGRITVEPLAGLGIAHGETRHTGVIFPSYVGPPHREPDQTLPDSNWTAVVFGLDIELPIAPHVGIIPAARVYTLFGRETEPPSLGMGSVIYRLGGGVEVRF